MGVLSCPICCKTFRLPVTLACGHTFDKDCLEQLVARAPRTKPRCPVDDQVFALPLPEIDFTLRAYLSARFPQRPDASAVAAQEGICTLDRSGGNTSAAIPLLTVVVVALV